MHKIRILLGTLVVSASLGLFDIPLAIGGQRAETPSFRSSDFSMPLAKAPLGKLCVREIEPLAFGLFIQKMHSKGRLMIDPMRKQLLAYHGNSVAGPAGPAQFEVTGLPNARFSISLPREVLLHTSNGHTLRLVDLMSSPSHTGILGPDGRARFFVGGTLLVDVPGVFGKASGVFDVFVDYVDP